MAEANAPPNPAANEDEGDEMQSAQRLELVDEDGSAEDLQQPNDPFEERNEADHVALGMPSSVATEPFPSDNNARIVAPTAYVPNDDEEDVCGVCFDPLVAGTTAKLLCCRNKLCLTHAQRVGQCPYCREEPLMWGLE
jgi:hypothetical protein